MKQKNGNNKGVGNEAGSSKQVKGKNKESVIGMGFIVDGLGKTDEPRMD